MHRIGRSIGTGLVALLLSAPVVPADAQLSPTDVGDMPDAVPQLPESQPRQRLLPDDAPARSDSRPRSAQHLSRAQAAAMAREAHGGRVLAVHWTGERYRVKLLRRGEVRIVHIEDAPSERMQQ